MINERELHAAIEETLAQKNPDARSCRNLAAYYTILDHINGQQEEKTEPLYSSAAPDPHDPIVYSGRSEFARIVNGLPMDDVMYVIEQLFEMLRATNRRTYEAALDELRAI